MTVTAIVGAQWGDEGKGRIIDFLAQEADVVIRFQGGDNAGHTVINEFGKHALHLVPSGIFNPATANIIGTGCVVNPQSVLAEMASLTDAGVSLDNLWISARAQMVMPYHRTLDELEEAARGKDTFGTTKRGIGPAYADKAARSGLRMGDLLQPDWLEARLDSALITINRKIEILGGQPVDGQELFALCMDYRDKLGDRIVDTVPMIRHAVENGLDILLEGQLGVMRDLDWGIYPYVTSSNPTAAFAASGAGLPARTIDRVIGVVKAYSTAVGDGPFPAELHDADGEKLRTIGGEFGATTGRPRRCGWFDGVAIGYAAWLNGMTGLAITKLDILDHFDSLKIITGYRLPDGTVITDTMPDTPILYQVTPIYEEWPGWLTSTEDCRTWDDLPKEARQYIHRLAELAGVKVDYVSVGAERAQMFAV
ncbi:MAG: adenylosuccinate synthase [Caldilineaceae bacterium]|nr:adenylosuccinate synthase [Caldilineaceae bacterium]MBP8106172.1 adenylosuccinate synthase [Caldilineaceae bacterium]MBP8124888.1 adenylosuccinate synthase [Caldilineaceae bacterium]